ncbi:MAG: hypothetical protein H6810_10050 [Phycisphaeraceae bacterium]|nr:MAG: hypothetical protein H6810_10050 [Phycisphaeraceae bacterium]
MNAEHIHPDYHDDPELRSTVEGLDALALSERDEPDEGFESRIASATRPGVVGSVTPPTRRHPMSTWWAVPVAACVLVGVVGLWLARSSPPAAGPKTTSVAWSESDVDDLLFIDGLAQDQALVIDTSYTTDSADHQTADELLFDVLGNEGGAS